MRPLPLFFFAFANAAGAFLEALKMESTSLFNAVYPLEQTGQLLLAREESVETEELFLALRRYKDNMVVFHFGGHAGSDVLHLEDQAADATGIANLLEAQKDTLRLVFLNGCATQGQVAQLQKRGIKAIVATSRPVDDTKARFFAEKFYAALADGQHTLREAFMRAKHELAIAYQQPVNLFRGILTTGSQTQEFEWGLYATNDADLDWKITDPFLSFTDLYKSSQQRFQSLREGAFRYLKIEDALLREIQPETPAGDTGFIPINVSFMGAEQELEAAVRRSWNQDPLHTILIGKGGMGKTVSLVHLWEQFLSAFPNTLGPIPLYLPLEEINDWEGNRKNHFLEDQLFQHYQLQGFRELLGEKSGRSTPRVLLLLDGIQHVQPDKLPILIEDINQWAAPTAYPNLQIIVTATDDLRLDLRYESWAAWFQVMELQPLLDSDIRTYLGGRYPLSTELLELLRNPMMLAMYKASQTQPPGTGFIEDISQGGELLYNVELMSRQGIQERYKNNPREAIFQRFILEHLIPVIGWTMYQADAVTIHRKDHSVLNLRSLLLRELPELIHESFFDTFDRDFDRYLDERRFDLPPRHLFNQVIREVCTEKLVLLIEENNTFRFLHTLFRDYAAARHVLNQIDLGLNQGSIPSILRNTLFDTHLCHMIGQIEGEHRLNPSGPPAHLHWANRSKKPNRIARILDICRGNFREQELGHTVRNLLQIILLNRTELAGVDLQLLDLRKIDLGNVRLTRPDNKGLTAQFFGARISRKTLIPDKNPLPVAFTRLNPDKARLLFASHTGAVQEWDIQSRICLLSATFNINLQNIRYSAEGRSLFLFTDTQVLEWRQGLDTLPRLLTDQEFELRKRAPDSLDTDIPLIQEKAKISPLAGMYLQGCSLEHLHPESQLEPTDKLLLRHYGAIFTGKDAKNRTQFQEKYFQPIN